MLYHYTSLFHIGTIMDKRVIKRTLSNTGFNNDVVWLTSSSSPEGLGLGNLVDDYDKKVYRITIRRMCYMKPWNKWIKANNQSENMAQTLIISANADEDRNTWYVSEKDIALEKVLLIENLKTGEILYNKAQNIRGYIAEKNI